MNKRIKYILAIAALVILMLVCVGCGKGEDTPASGSDVTVSAETELDTSADLEEELVADVEAEETENAEAEEDKEKDKEDEKKKDEDKKAEEPKKPAYPYYIEVNRSSNCITIYTYDDNGNYTVPVKAMVCSVGKGSRTPTGSFKTSSKYRWHQLNGGVYGQYCTRITGHILFHSVPYAKAQNDTLKYNYYNQLGSKASAGCIRLTTADAKWIYDNCKSGTTVKIFDGSGTGPLGKPSAVKIDTSSPNRGWDPTDPDPNNPWRNQAPVLAGVKDITVEYGQTADLTSHVTATDYKGEGITPVVSCNVDFKTPGSYTITYTATDANGKSVTATAVVKIQDTTAPVITLSQSSITVTEGTSETDIMNLAKSKYTVSDASSVTTDVAIVSGDVKIVATDACGNKSEKVIDVIYEKVQQPEPTPDPDPEPDPEPTPDPDPEPGEGTTPEDGTTEVQQPAA